MEKRKYPRRPALWLLVIVGLVSAPSLASAQEGKRTISQQDQGFVTQAWIINTAEIRLGVLAEQRAQSPAVKAFGQRLAQDHGRMLTQLTELTAAHGGALPTMLDAEHQEIEQRLSGLTGFAFDQQFIQAMIDGHKKALATFSAEARGREQTPFDQWAARSAPTLRQHLQTAESIQKQLNEAPTF